MKYQTFEETDMETKSVYTAEEFRALSAKSRNRSTSPEDELAMQLLAANIDFERQVKFHPERKFRADFSILNGGVLIECNGGVFSRGKMGHNSGSGITRDYEKNNEAVLLGYFVLQFSTEMVLDGRALRTIMRLVHGDGKNWKPGKSR